MANRVKENDIVFFVVSDMNATLNAENVSKINYATELNFDDVNNVTYQMLHDARLQTMGGNHCGSFKKLNGVEYWVLPTPKAMNLTINVDNTDIVEYSYNDFKNLVWDIEQEEEIDL